MRTLILSTLIVFPSTALALTGSGAQLDPYIVSTCQDLSDIRLDTDAYYELGGDIDCTVSPFASGFTPIPAFTGELDGQG